MSAIAISTARSNAPSFRVTLCAIAAGIALLAGLIAVPFANAHAQSTANTAVTSQQ
jgi:hypothetical protein